MSKRCAQEVWSFFSGGMGLDLGLEAAGIQASLAVEMDATCCATIRHNRPDLDVWETDASVIDADALRVRRGNPDEVFLMVGGPPCQSFSSGGKRAALSDPRGNLIYTYLRLVESVRPKYFVLENVANIVTAAIRHRPIDQQPRKGAKQRRCPEHRRQRFRHLRGADVVGDMPLESRRLEPERAVFRRQRVRRVIANENQR